MEKPNEVYEAKSCVVCGKKLSQYNPGKECWSHSMPSGARPSVGTVCMSRFNKGIYIVRMQETGTYHAAS